jgi:hypothetical protein
VTLPATAITSVSRIPGTAEELVGGEMYGKYGTSVVLQYSQSLTSGGHGPRKACSPPRPLARLTVLLAAAAGPTMAEYPAAERNRLTRQATTDSGTGVSETKPFDPGEIIRVVREPGGAPPA